MLPILPEVHFEDSPDRLKVILPVSRQWAWLILFTVLTAIWLIGLVWGIVFIVRDIAFSGERYAIVFTLMLLIWLYIWYRLGKIVWRQWQYYAAGREILFIEKERLIIRRPVAILGITDAYDMSYVSPFSYIEDKQCAAFDYAQQRVYFGLGLDPSSAKQLVNVLNERFFSTMDHDDEY